MPRACLAESQPPCDRQPFDVTESTTYGLFWIFVIDDVPVDEFEKLMSMTLQFPFIPW